MVKIHRITRGKCLARGPARSQSRDFPAELTLSPACHGPHHPHLQQIAGWSPSPCLPPGTAVRRDGRIYLRSQASTVLGIKQILSKQVPSNSSPWCHPNVPEAPGTSFPGQPLSGIWSCRGRSFNTHLFHLPFLWASVRARGPFFPISLSKSRRTFPSHLGERMQIPRK